MTAVLDDYSRAVAGSAVYFAAPSAIETALALRQAIWRKARPGWQICGIPEFLYSDHGSVFHLPVSRASRRRPEDPPDQLRRRAAPRPGEDQRFFETITRVLLSRLPGSAPAGTSPAAVLTLGGLDAEVEPFLVEDYHVASSETRVAPQERWGAGGFLPRMPDSLELLVLLSLTVARTRRVHRDGIRFSGMCYIDPMLAAYVGEEGVLRYDRRDVAEVRVFHEGRFLCRAVCQELAGETVPLREILRAR